MLYPELRGYLVGACSTEEVVQFDAGIQLLEDFEVDDHMDVFDTVLGEVSVMGDTQTIDSLKVTLLASTRGLIEMQGVLLVDDVTQETVLLLGKAMQRLADWSDKQTLLNIIAQDHSAEERFCEMVATVVGLNETDFLPYIDSIDAGLLPAIKELCQEEDNIPEAFEEEVQSYISDYRKVRNKVQSKTLWADFVLVSLPALGIPFEIHLKHFLQSKNELVSNLLGNAQYDLLSEELMGIAAISAERLSGALTSITAHMDEITLDLNQSMMLIPALNKFFVEVNRAQT